MASPRAKLPSDRLGKDKSANAKKKLVMEYMTKGLTAEEAYAVANPGHAPTKRLMQMYRKEHQTVTLSNPVLVEAAQNVIAETLDGLVLERNGEKIIPTYSNRLQAAQMVLDRAEPIIKINQNLNINSSVNIIDLSNYLSTSNCATQSVAATMSVAHPSINSDK